MSQVKEPFPPGPVGPEHDASAEDSLLISLPLGKTLKHLCACLVFHTLVLCLTEFILYVKLTP